MAAERLSLRTDSLATQAVLLGEYLSAAMEPTFAAHGLKPATFDLLSTIHAAGPAATQASIAHRLGIKPPSLTEALRSLKHLVEQVPSPTDSRAKHLRLTDRGREALSASIKAIEAASRAIAAEIDKGELAIAVDVLKRANQILARATSQSW